MRLAAVGVILPASAILVSNGRNLPFDTVPLRPMTVVCGPLQHHRSRYASNQTTLKLKVRSLAGTGCKELDVTLISGNTDDLAMRGRPNDRALTSAKQKFH